MTIKRFIGKSWPIKGDGAEFVLQFAVHNFAKCTVLQFAVLHNSAQYTVLKCTVCIAICSAQYYS